MGVYTSNTPKMVISLIGEPQNLSWAYFREIAYGTTLLASTLPPSCLTMMVAGGIE